MLRAVSRAQRSEAWFTARRRFEPRLRRLPWLMFVGLGLEAVLNGAGTFCWLRGGSFRRSSPGYEHGESGGREVRR